MCCSMPTGVSLVRFGRRQLSRGRRRLRAQQSVATPGLADLSVTGFACAFLFHQVCFINEGNLRRCVAESMTSTQCDSELPAEPHRPRHKPNPSTGDLSSDIPPKQNGWSLNLVHPRRAGSDRIYTGKKKKTRHVESTTSTGNERIALGDAVADIHALICPQRARVPGSSRPPRQCWPCTHP
jgi:hypothetical protein